MYWTSRGGCSIPLPTVGTSFDKNFSEILVLKLRKIWAKSKRKNSSMFLWFFPNKFIDSKYIIFSFLFQGICPNLCLSFLCFSPLFPQILLEIVPRFAQISGKEIEINQWKFDQNRAKNEKLQHFEIQKSSEGDSQNGTWQVVDNSQLYCTLFCFTFVLSFSEISIWQASMYSMWHDVRP